METKPVQYAIFDERYLAEIRTEAYPGERLVVFHVPVLGEYRRRKREDLLAATEEELAKIAREVVRRTKTPFMAPQIAEKVGRAGSCGEGDSHLLSREVGAGIVGGSGPGAVEGDRSGEVFSLAGRTVSGGPPQRPLECC